MDQETRRYIDDLLRGRTVANGLFNLAASPAASTSVTRLGVSSGSVVLVSPYSNAVMSDIRQIVPAKDAFVVHHVSSSTTPRTFRYVFLTGQ
jgi:hypothetical protein